MTRPLAPKTTVLISIQRMRLAVSACCSGEKPGAITRSTRTGAKNAPMRGQNDERQRDQVQHAAE